MAHPSASTRLFTCLYGSRLYGTQTPTSDRDIKHIVLPSIDSLLLGQPPVTRVKKTNDVEHVSNTADDVDEVTIPLHVFARDFCKGQTYALELAFAVEGDHAEQLFHGVAGMDGDTHRWYQATGDIKLHPFYELVRELRAKFLTSNIDALVGYAVQQASLYSFKGERLDVSRKFMKALEERLNDDRTKAIAAKKTLGEFYHEHLGFNMDVSELLKEFPNYFKLESYDIGGGQQRPCFKLLEKTFPFTNTMEHSLKVAKTIIGKYGNRAAAAVADHVDWKAMMHAVRIVDEGIALLSTSWLTFPLPQADVDHLLMIKRGELPIQAVKDELEDKLARLQELKLTTKLPPISLELYAELDEWLLGWLKRFYKVS